MPNLYVWDFHGTLEKGNEHCVREICTNILEQYGYYRKVTLDEVLYLYGSSWKVYYKTLVPSLTDGMIDKMVEDSVALSEKIAANYIKPMDYALDALLTLKTKGHVNIIVSNCRQNRLDAFSEMVGITPLVAAKIGISEKEIMLENDVVKQKAAFIMKFANGQKFNKLFMIGDRETDVEAGLLAGATAVLFNPRKANVDTKAHYTITDLREVLNF